MKTDDALFARADATLGQHFLVAHEKLKLLVGAADIQPTDNVVEVGAGAGTVARELPACRSLTLIELDDDLTNELMVRLPHARVIQGDALALLGDFRCDVLLSNLPFPVTAQLLAMLPSLEFRTAVLSASPELDLHQLDRTFTVTTVAVLEPNDFRPLPPGSSILLKLDRRDLRSAR